MENRETGTFPSALGPRVAAERIRLMYQQTFRLLAVNIVNGLLVLVARWGWADWRICLGWGLVFGLVVGLRALLVSAYHRKRPADGDMASWGRYYTIGSTASGLVWGAAVLLFLHPGDYLGMMLMAFVIGGTVAGSVTFLACNLATFAWYLPVTLLPLAGHLLIEGDRVSLVMGFMVLLYMAGMWMAGRNFNATLTSSLRLSEQNAGLLVGLKEQLRQRELDLLETRRLQVEADAANAAKSRFFATMSHELRTPFTGILGMVELLRSSNLPGDAPQQLNVLDRCARVLLGLLNDLLDFSKIEAGQMAVEQVPFDLRPVLSDLSQLYGTAATTKGLALTLAMPEGNLTGLGDMFRLRQVVVNFLSNAIKFTQQGGVTCTASLAEGGAEGRRLTVSVSDTGPGITPDVAARLFQPFSQGDTSTSRNFGGTGLGLAICKRIAEAMGGTVGLRSTEAAGATFWLEIPFPATALAAVNLQTEAKTSVPRETRPRRILLADDNEVNRLVIGNMLRRAGHEVALAEDGQEAVDAVVAQDFDLILLDMQMPVLDGREATRAIRAMLPPKGSIPIAALTADAMTENRGSYMKAGLNELLTKPIRATDLQAAVERLTGKRGDQ